MCIRMTRVKPSCCRSSIIYYDSKKFTCDVQDLTKNAYTTECKSYPHLCTDIWYVFKMTYNFQKGQDIPINGDCCVWTAKKGCWLTFSSVDSCNYTINRTQTYTKGVFSWSCCYKCELGSCFSCSKKKGTRGEQKMTSRERLWNKFGSHHADTRFCADCTAGQPSCLAHRRPKVQKIYLWIKKKNKRNVDVV